MADIVTQLRDKWFILAFLAGVIMWYSNVNSRLNTVEANQATQSDAISQIGDMKTDIAVIKSNVQFIKDQISHK